MDTIILDDSTDDDSILELAIPPKLAPPLINIDDEDGNTIVSLDMATTPKKLSRNARKRLRKMRNNMNVNMNKNMNMRASEISKQISPNHWTEEMMNFYNEDWGNEDTFNVNYFQSHMSRNPRLWLTESKDNNKRHRVRCTRCQSYGHVKRHCHEHISKVCYMCGEEGHRSFKCPKSQCLHCGKRSNGFRAKCAHCVKNCSPCYSCMNKGLEYKHKYCPETWRQFHSTIKEGPIIPLRHEIIKQNLWCCVCGLRGHYFANCPSNLHGGPTLPSMNTPLNDSWNPSHSTLNPSGQFKMQTQFFRTVENISSDFIPLSTTEKAFSTNQARRKETQPKNGFVNTFRATNQCRYFQRPLKTNEPVINVISDQSKTNRGQRRQNAQKRPCLNNNLNTDDSDNEIDHFGKKRPHKWRKFGRFKNERKRRSRNGKLHQK